MDARLGWYWSRPSPRSAGSTATCGRWQRFRSHWACLGWLGRCRVAGGPSTATKLGIWRVLGWWRLYCRRERQPFPWRSSIRGMPCSQGLQLDCCCVHSPRLRSPSRFTNASPRPGPNTSQRRAPTARRPRRGPWRSRLDLRASLRMSAAWTQFDSRIQRLSRPDLHQRSLSIGSAVVAHASTTFLSTGTRKHAKPPRPSESVFSACTVLTGLTWSAAAWMTWFGRPASRPLAYITGLARSYPEDKLTPCQYPSTPG